MSGRCLSYLSLILDSAQCVIAATSSNLRETDIKRISQNFLFEFEELNEHELEILDRVQIPQKFSFGFEYIQTRKESGIFEEVPYARATC